MKSRRIDEKQNIDHKWGWVTSDWCLHLGRSIDGIDSQRDGALKQSKSKISIHVTNKNAKRVSAVDEEGVHTMLVMRCIKLTLRSESHTLRVAGITGSTTIAGVSVANMHARGITRQT